jgi:hypothetical protein
LETRENEKTRLKLAKVGKSMQKLGLESMFPDFAEIKKLFLEIEIIMTNISSVLGTPVHE